MERPGHRRVPRLPPLLLLCLLACVTRSLAIDLHEYDPFYAPTPAPAPANCTAAEGTCVRIGYFSCPPTAPDSACASIVGYDRLQHWYRQRIAARLDGRLAGVPVRWVEARLSGFASFTAAEVYDSVNQTFIGSAAHSGTGPALVDFVILPFGSSWDTAMTLLEEHHIPSVSSLSPDRRLFQCGPTPDVWKMQAGCTAPNTRRFLYAHGASNPGEQFLEPWVSLLKLRKAASLAVLHVDHSFYKGVRAGVVAAAADNGIALLMDRLVEYDGEVLSAHTVDTVMRELQDLPSQPDAVALVVHDCVPWLEAFRDADYSPKSVAAIMCAENPQAARRLGSDLNFITGSSQWSVDMIGSEYTESADTQPWSLFPHERGGQTVGVSSPLQFQTLLRSLVNSSTFVPGHREAGVLPAYSMLEAAITLANSVHPVHVQAQLKILWQTSYYGLLTINRYGQNQQKQMVVTQRDHTGVLHIISPTSVSTHDFIYPMPRYSERVYRHALFSSTIERVLLALIGFCCLFTGGLMAYLFHHRRRQIFQAAGLPFYLLQGAGCLMAYVSVLTWGVENNVGTCSARIWLWTLSFHLFVDPMLASSYRISRIFSFKIGLGRISNAQLGGVCVAIASPQLLLNILWSSLAPLEPHVVTVDPLRPAFTSFTTCSGGSLGEIFAALTLVYSGLLLVAACALAYKVRAAYKLFNDARPIAISMYLFSMTAGVVLVVQETLNHPRVADQRVLFGLRSIGLLVAYQGSIALLYLRRIIDVLAGAYRGGTAFVPVTEVSLRPKPPLSVSPQTLLAPNGAFASAIVIQPEPVRAPTPAPLLLPQQQPAAAPLASMVGTLDKAPESDETATRPGNLSTPLGSPDDGGSGGRSPGGIGIALPHVVPLALSDQMEALASAVGPFPPRQAVMQLGRHKCVMLLEQYWTIIQHLRSQADATASAAGSQDGGASATGAASPVISTGAPVASVPAVRPTPERAAPVPVSPVLVVRGLVYPTSRPGGMADSDAAAAAIASPSDGDLVAPALSYPSSSHAQRDLDDAVRNELSPRLEEIEHSQSSSQLPGVVTISRLPDEDAHAHGDIESARIHAPAHSAAAASAASLAPHSARCLVETPRPHALPALPSTASVPSMLDL